MKFPWPLFLMLHLTLLCTAQDGTVDTTFNTSDIGYFNGDGASGVVRTSVMLSDGKILIGGEFQNYNGSRHQKLVRLFADGRLDTSFNRTGSGVDGFAVNFVKALPDGKLLIAGDFLKYNNVSRHLIARLNSDGSLDTSFHAGNAFSVHSSIMGMVIQPDGRILISGSFVEVAGVPRNGIARLLPDGKLDTTFQPDESATGKVITLACQSTGKIIIAGTLYQNNVPVKYLRLDSTGKLDAGFQTGTGPDNYVTALQVQPDDRIILGGDFITFNGSSRKRVARLLPDGSLDTGFVPDLQLSGPVYTIALNNSGKVLVGGFFNGIYRLNPDGTRDSLFNPNAAVDGFVTNGPLGSAFNIVNSLMWQADGKYLVGGNFRQFGGSICNHVLRITESGYRDTSFNRGSGANRGIYALKVQGDGKILIAGGFTAFNDKAVYGITRLQPDGSLDTAFNKNGTGLKDLANIDRIYAMDLQPDGKIMIGGDFIRYNGSQVQNIARLLANGNVDNSFLPGKGPEGFVYALAVQPDEKIMVGGGFSYFNGMYHNGLVRLKQDGSVDASFESKFGLTHVEVRHITTQADGKYLVSGSFWTYAGLTRRHIVRLLPNGDLDPSFNMGTGTNDYVVGTVVQPDGKILVSGRFNSYNNIPVAGLIRLKPDGTIDSSFTGFKPGMDCGMPCLLPDGKILVAVYGSSPTDSGAIIRLHPNGAIDTAFSGGGGWKAGTGINFDLSAVGDWMRGISPVLQGQGKVLVHGLFWSYNGIGKNRLALLNNSTTPSLSMGSIMPASICAGGNVNIPFNSMALAPGTVITAQLSDSTGDFSNPIIIGTASGLSHGQLAGTIPSNVPAGTAYRIRLASSQPNLLTTDNGTNIRINAFAGNPAWIGAYSTNWNDVRNWCGGIPSATTDATIAAGTPFNPTISYNAQARNITLDAGASLTMEASGFLDLLGNINSEGTLDMGNGAIQFRGTARQTIPAMTIAKMTLNGTGGVALKGNLIVTQSLTLTKGHLTLGAYDLFLKGISFGSLSSHIITNATGSVISTDGAATTILSFPVGADSASYNPISVNGTGGKNFAVRVTNTLPATVSNPSKAVNRTWQIVPTAALSFPASVQVQFSDAEGNSSYSPAVPFEAGINNGSVWKTIAPAVPLFGAPSARFLTFNTSDFGDIVIGNQGMIQAPPAVDPSNPVDPTNPNNPTNPGNPSNPSNPVNPNNSDSTYAELRPTLVTTNQVELKLNVHQATLINWSIISLTGTTVYQFNQKAHAGENSISINLPSLAPGMYQLVGKFSSGRTLVIRFARL